MKFASSIAVFITSMFVTLTAMGGHGASGGGLGKTKLLLQTFGYERAILSLDGVTNIPDTDPTPRLVIPDDEYGDFVIEAHNAAATGIPFVLPPIELSDGSFRCYVLEHSPINEEPLFMSVTLTECE
jgi:hypothetical protein